MAVARPSAIWLMWFSEPTNRISSARPAATPGITKPELVSLSSLSAGRGDPTHTDSENRNSEAGQAIEFQK